MPASISSKTIVSPPATAAIASAIRESSPPDAVSATWPNGSPRFGRTRNVTASAPVAPGLGGELGAELALPSPTPASSRGDGFREPGPAARSRAARSSACEAVDLAPARAPSASAAAA